VGLAPPKQKILEPPMYSHTNWKGHLWTVASVLDINGYRYSFCPWKYKDWNKANDKNKISNY